MKWTFQNEARWMLWLFGLVPAILILFSLVLPRLLR